MLLLNALSAIGLFLLGIWLMTEGLKLAGGKALESLLQNWTSSKPRGLAAGLLITTLVQSSSAVIIASIGFINAGFLGFTQSIWVVFGSSLGSTFTGWLVTFFGFKVNIGVVSSIPIAVGAALRVFSPYERGRFLGMALAGFGLMFMGIDVMKTTFTSELSNINIEEFFNLGHNIIIIGFILGLVLTVLTQASSAAIAIIMTASASNFAGFEMAAAAVIGANIGTTSTSLMTMIGATPGAKRLALAHVIFNMLSGVIGFLVLPILVSFEQHTTFSDPSFAKALLLVMFHTGFNALGLLIMVPLEPPVTRFLQTLFQHKKPSNAPQTTLQFIDQNVAAIPEFALHALQRELHVLLKQLESQSLFKIIYQPKSPLKIEEITLTIDAINQFVINASQANLTREQSTLFTEGLSLTHYLRNSFHTLQQMRDIAPTIQRLDHTLTQALNGWMEKVDAFIAQIDNPDEKNEEIWPALYDNYLHVKKHILALAIGHSQRLGDVDDALLFMSLSKYLIEQIIQITPALERLLPNNNEEKAALA